MLLDRIDVQNGDGAETDVVREPKGLEHESIVDKILNGVDHSGSGLDALLDVAVKSWGPRGRLFR